MSKKTINKITDEKANENKLADSIFSKINSKQIKPKSKKELFYRSISMYILIATGIFILSLIVLISFNTFNRNIFFQVGYRENLLMGIFFAVPWGLVLISLIVLSLSIYIITKTEFGYKYRKLFLVPATVLAIGLFGGLIYASGFRHFADQNRIQPPSSEADIKFRGKLVSSKKTDEVNVIVIEDRDGDQTKIEINKDTNCRPIECEEIGEQQNIFIGGWGQKSEDDDLDAKAIEIMVGNKPKPGQGSKGGPQEPVPRGQR